MNNKSVLENETGINTNDLHLKIVNDLTKKLKTNFPNAGIGISGSVAAKKHSRKSDIDLLLVDKTFKKNKQFTFFNYGVDINLLCLNPNLLENQISVWSFLFNSQHLGYITSANIIFDPESSLGELKEKTKEIIIQRKSSAQQVLMIVEEQKEIIIKEIENNGCNCSKSVELINLLISQWFLLEGILLNNKREHQNSFNLIKKYDYKMYESLKLALLQSIKNEEVLNHIETHLQKK